MTKTEWTPTTTWLNCYICCKPLDGPMHRASRHERSDRGWNKCRSMVSSLRPPIPMVEWDMNK
jgi:hypothetical protein